MTTLAALPSLETARRGRSDLSFHAPKRRSETMGYGLVGILVIILLIALIVYFVRRA